jgi:hypothetical protein
MLLIRSVDQHVQIPDIDCISSVRTLDITDLMNRFERVKGEDKLKAVHEYLEGTTSKKISCGKLENLAQKEFAVRVGFAPDAASGQWIFEPGMSLEALQTEVTGRLFCFQTLVEM